MKDLPTLLIATTLLLSPLKINDIKVENRQESQKKDINQMTNFLKEEKNCYKKLILDNLKNKKHSYRKNDQCPETEYYENILPQINLLQTDQLKVIHIMLENLKYRKFKSNIGDIITRDVGDLYVEYGGIIKMNSDKNLKLIELESDLARLKEYNESYILPKKVDSIDYFAEFHLHATTYNETPFSGPSSSDIIIQEAKANRKHQVHEFVITSLKKGKFNIDYYGTDRRINKKSKVIDLGNYYY